MVVPLFKKDGRNDLSNYRAISLLSSVSKVFELRLKDKLTSFFYKDNLLNPSQHGFTRSKSTETALCDFQVKIVDALDRNKAVVGLFIDFLRAFDLLDHNILLAKFHRCGIRGVPLGLMESYLQERRQYVTVNGKNSDCGFLTLASRFHKVQFLDLFSFWSLPSLHSIIRI